MSKCIKCGSYAFNLYKEEIDQGGLCDVHYWQGRAHRAEALAEQLAQQQEPKKDLMWSTVAMQERHDQRIQKVVATLERIKQEQLAEQPARQQEPVACKTLCELCVKRGYHFCANAAQTTPIPSPPASKPWVGLTKEDRYKAIRPLYCNDATAALAACHSNDEYKAIEAKLKEKNT